MYEVEKFHFMRELAEKQIGQDVTAISAMGVFLEVVGNGMSFSQASKHVYIMSRSVKTANGYEKRLVYSTSPDGKIFQCQRAGSIDYVTKPVIVYEGDEFGIGTNDQGNQIVRHTVKVPRASQKIIAGYVYVVYKNGTREPFWMDMNDIERLKGYSAKQNRDRGANALYASGVDGQIDTGFFGAKLISFALKNVRRSVISAQHEVDEEIMEQAVTYEQLPTPDPNANYQATAVVTPAGQLEQAPPATTQNNSATPAPF
jgi:recombinational DNA repair protein RecT